MQIFLDAFIHTKKMDIWYVTNHEYAKSIGAEQTLILDRYRERHHTIQQTVIQLLLLDRGSTTGKNISHAGWFHKLKLPCHWGTVDLGLVSF